jgi:hypothetical protein
LSSELLLLACCDEKRSTLTDSARAQVLLAQREVEVIRILADHAGLSAAARDRIDDALEIIGSALEMRWAATGLQPRAAVAA